jgi:hypothetical protein
LYLLYVMKALSNKLTTSITASLIACVALLAFTSGCATSEKSKTTSEADMESALVAPSFSSVNFEHSIAAIGDVIRAFGEQVGGGIVLMSGLEERAAPALAFRQMPYQEAVAELAGFIECDYIHTPHYYMILPPEYHVLENMQIGDALDVRYAALSASVAFGAKTELYKVFAVLGESLDITIIADNIIAEARCGELFIEELPLPVVLQALLQSARIMSDSVVVESTPEYIFIRSVQNVGETKRVLNKTAMTPEQQTLLDKSVSLTLPNRSASAQGAFASNPIPLSDALLPLTEQLGVEVVAQRRLADIPINPCQMNAIPMETALNLLLRQWPLFDFGFEVQEGRILIREK